MGNFPLLRLYHYLPNSEAYNKRETNADHGDVVGSPLGCQTFGNRNGHQYEGDSRSEKAASDNVKFVECHPERILGRRRHSNDCSFVPGPCMPRVQEANERLAHLH